MSDIAGYRSDGGALGQDQGLTKNLKGILTAKAPLLSAPGTVLENTLYYDINSSSVTAVEMQATFAKDKIVLNNLTAGSSPSAYIPSVLFAGTLFWNIELVDFTLGPDDPVLDEGAWNCCIPEGWGFSALSSIIVYMGASTIAQIPISGMTNFLVNAACCETFSKRRAMVKQAGRYLNWQDRRSALAVPEASTPFWTAVWTSGFASPASNLQTFTSPELKYASVPLRLPFTSMAVLDKRLSFDTKLTTQPIQITLQTKQFKEFMILGPNVAAALGSSYKNSSIQLWQEELSDKSLSVRNELLAMPEFNVSMPFQYAQSIPFEILATGNNVGNTDYIFKMNITSIINSDLTTFLFNVTWNGRTDPAGGQLQPLYGEQLLDIELLLNGQRFFSFEQGCYEGVTLAKQIDDPMIEMLLPSKNYNATTDETAANQAYLCRSHMYEFNNSRLRAIVGEDNLQNTARFTNQTFQLQFRINRNLLYLLDSGALASQRIGGGFTTTSGYTLNMTYLYNAVFLVGGDGGTTKLITN